MLRHNRLLRPVAATAFGVVAAVLVVRTEAPLALVEADRPAQAVALAPDNAPAHMALAAAAFASGHNAVAHTHAITALAQAPLDQASATIAALTSPPRQALALSNLSAALGWRDPKSQLLLAQGAAAQGAWEQFAQRIDAYARLQSDMRETGPLIDRMIAAPQARDAIARRLTFAPAWRAAYFLTLDSGVPQAAENRVALLRRIVADGGHLSDTDIRENVRRLIGVNAWRQALSIWRDTRRSTDSLNDARFEQVGTESDTVPFGWIVANTIRGFAIREDMPDGRKALHVQYDASSIGPLIGQTLVLVPGTYEVDVTYAIRPPRNAANWQVRCDSDTGNVLGKTAAGATAMTFTIPAGCTTQRLSLLASPTTDAQPLDLWIAKAAVTRRRARSIPGGAPVPIRPPVSTGDARS